MNTDFLSNQALAYNSCFVVHVSLFGLQCITANEKGSLIVIVINIIIDGGVVVVIEVFVIVVVVFIIPVSTDIITSISVHLQGENLHPFVAPLLGLAKSITIIIINIITVIIKLIIVMHLSLTYLP